MGVWVVLLPPGLRFLAVRAVRGIDPRSIRRHRPINKCGPPPGYTTPDIDDAKNVPVLEWMNVQAQMVRKVWVRPSAS